MTKITIEGYMLLMLMLFNLAACQRKILSRKLFTMPSASEPGKSGNSLPHKHNEVGIDTVATRFVKVLVQQDSL